MTMPLLITGSTACEVQGTWSQSGIQIRRGHAKQTPVLKRTSAAEFVDAKKRKNNNKKETLNKKRKRKKMDGASDQIAKVIRCILLTFRSFV